MDQNMFRTHRSWAQWLAAAAALTLLAACEAPQRSADYREQHKVTVGKETISLILAMPPAGDGLAGIEASKFELFVQRYIEAGLGLITVEAAGDAAERARGLLMKQGVRGADIAVAPGAGNSVVLTYTAANVTVPACDDWSSNATFNWSNRVHSNFGCAVQRNIGLMVRNPADLDRAREMKGADGERGAGVITNYRTAPKVLGVQKQKSAVTSQ